MTEVTAREGEGENQWLCSEGPQSCEIGGRNGLFPGSALRWALSIMLRACRLLQSQGKRH